jgi:hypothetical protein
VPPLFGRRHVFQGAVDGCYAGAPPAAAAAQSLDATAAFIKAFASGGSPPFPEYLGFPKTTYQMRYPDQSVVDSVKKVVFNC